MNVIGTQKGVVRRKMRGAWIYDGEGGGEMAGEDMCARRRRFGR